MIDRLLDTTRRKIDFLLWDFKLHDATWVQASSVRFLRVMYGASRDIGSGMPYLRATGLVYTTLLSLVPLLAVSVSVLKGFGVHNQLEPFLVNILETLGDRRHDITTQILSFVDNMKLGALGSIGLLFLIVTVLSMVKKIESAFNATWRIADSRNIFKRFSNYLSVILIGPLLLFVATSIATSLRSHTVTETVLSVEPFGSMLLAFGQTLPVLLTVIAFTLIYELIPNTRVKITSAVYGAIIATIMWKAVGMLFTMFIVNSTNYTAIYSGFAILIIFMIWIHTSWLIILTGASIAYYHQNPEQIGSSHDVVRLSCRLREKLALSIMQLIGSSFHHERPAWTLKKLVKQTRMSETAIEPVLQSLIQKNIIVPGCKNGSQFLPARSLEKIQIKDILAAARQAEESGTLHPDEVVSDDKVRETYSHVQHAIDDSVSEQTLRDLVMSQAETEATDTDTDADTDTDTDDA